jgi:uncharacterized membrane protein YgdD (TMEM256/DUF423 family)
MHPWSVRVVVGVALGFLLVVGGFGATALAHEMAQDCHERWDDVPEAHADCEDALYAIMLYGGVLFGTFGVALLAAAAREHWSEDGAEPGPAVAPDE